MYGELIFNSSENYTKYIKSLCEQNVEFCNMKHSNTQSNYIVTFDYNIKSVVGLVTLALVLKTVLFPKSALNSL